MAEKFVKMVKAGEEPIEVNPSVVENHKQLGWKVQGEEPAAAVEEKAKGGKQKAEGGRRRSGKRAAAKEPEAVTGDEE